MGAGAGVGERGLSGEVGAGEVGAGEVGAGEVDAGEVGGRGRGRGRGRGQRRARARALVVGSCCQASTALRPRQAPQGQGRPRRIWN